jgi:succinate dehydrogenase / fumarate reductase flavoprotein subunit
MANNQIRVAIVGGGLAGLAAAMKIAEAGHSVELFSVVPVKRSHSVCAQGGINGAVNTKGEGDSPWKHFDDTVYGGDFLANQPPVRKMCEMAPSIIYLFDRMGVPFSRTTEGLLDFRRFGGTLHHRTAFAGASTGQQLLYALDEQVRRAESEGKVKKYEHWEMLSLVQDGHGVCRGLVAMERSTLELKVFPADAVIMATGGPGLIFGKSTNSMVCTGSAVSVCYQQGARYANGEFIQVHPTSIPGEDKLRLMSESARGEGGRVWVPKQKGDKRQPSSIPESERWYFLEEKYPAYGNLVPRDIATREIFQVCLDGFGVFGESQVYLDLTHIPAETLDRKLGAILEIYEMFVGLRTAHEYSGTPRRGRVRLLDSRREPTRRELARQLRLWRLHRRARRNRVREELATQRCGRLEDLRRRVEASAGDQRATVEAVGHGESVRHTRRDGQVDDGQRDGRPLQRQAEGDG